MDTKVLEGYRVVELSQWFQGADAAAMLGDLGADVFKIEQLGTGDQTRGLAQSMGVSATLPHGRNVFFEYYNRNKRGIALDLKSPQAPEVLHRLVQNCDIFITNYLPHQLEKLGLDYATLSRANLRLIYAKASLYGDRGPDSDLPGFDPSITARSGLLMACGHASTEGPDWVVGGLADQTGALALGFAILSAITARERFGIGQEVQTSSFGAMLKLLSMNLILQLMAGKSMARADIELLPPLARFYKCSDARWIQVTVFREMDWIPLCRAIDRTDLLSDPDFDKWEKRMSNPKLAGILAETFAAKSREEWLEVFRKARLAHAPINDMADVASDPMALANDYIVQYDHPDLGKVKFIGYPWQLGRTPAEISRPAPQLGEHTEDILIDLCGYDWAEITRLKQQGVI